MDYGINLIYNNANVNIVIPHTALLCVNFTKKPDANISKLCNVHHKTSCKNDSYKISKIMSTSNQMV